MQIRYDATVESYKVGKSTAQDILDAEAQLAQAEKQLSDHRFHVVYQWLSLRAMLGELQTLILRQLTRYCK